MVGTLAKVANSAMYFINYFSTLQYPIFRFPIFSIRYSVFGIQYSAFSIPYSVFRIPYSVFRIPYSVSLQRITLDCQSLIHLPYSSLSCIRLLSHSIHVSTVTLTRTLPTAASYFWICLISTCLFSSNLLFGLLAIKGTRTTVMHINYDNGE